MSMDAKGKYKADGLVDLLGQKQSLNWLIEHWLEQGSQTRDARSESDHHQARHGSERQPRPERGEVSARGEQERWQSDHSQEDQSVESDLQNGAGPARQSAQRQEGQPDFQAPVHPDGPFHPLAPAPEKPAAQGQAAEKYGQYGTESPGGGSEYEGGPANPGDLVNEPGKARQEETDNGQRVFHGAHDNTVRRFSIWSLVRESLFYRECFHA